MPSTTNVLVVDASALALAIVDAGNDGSRVRTRLAGEVIAGPDLLRVEVMSVIRRHARNGALTAQGAENAIRDLLEFPISIFPTATFLGRAWELRANLTSYDACYVALAEAVEGPLLTADARLARAPGIRCSVEIV